MGEGGGGGKPPGWRFTVFWVLVKGFNVSYHNKETIVFTKDPYHGNLKYSKSFNKNPVKPRAGGLRFTAWSYRKPLAPLRPEASKS